MAVPKRKVSKRKIRQRRNSSAHKKATPSVSVCAQCGALQRPHRVCKACGYYKGRQVITVQVD